VLASKRSIDRKLEVIKKTNPRRIYVENVRSFFRLPTPLARFYCELAVREGLFTKHVGLLCPNDGRIIKSIEPGATLPESVVCEICQEIGEQRAEFSGQEVGRIEYYALRKAD